jgi:4-hydroxy-tetrahydrodipicolinate synthase
MSQVLRGIFPVLQTPLDAAGELDEGSLARQVEFCLAAGAHGLVYPALGSELQYLSDRERQRLSEVVLRTAAGRVPVVVAVSAPSKAIAIAHARHARSAGAAALMALPPYLASATADEILDYYQGIGAAGELPLIVQNAPPGVTPGLLVRLLNEVPLVRYIKEEAAVSAHNLSAVVAAVGERCDGIFGGAYGRWMLSELRRGASGFMPAAEVVDVYVAVWEAFAAGDEQTARAIFNRLLPLINQLLLLGLPVSKAVLVRRGVFATAGMRTPGSIALDEHDRHELDAILADLQPWFRA